MGISERKEREKEFRRESILDAAEKIFFEKGLVATTIDEIAQGAEISKGTIYLYYKSKDDIYLGILCRGFDLLAIKLRDAVKGPDSTLKKLDNIGSAYVNFSETHKNYFRMFSYLDNPQFHSMASEELLIAGNQKSLMAWEIIIEIIKQGIADKTFKEDIDPTEMAIILWSNATALIKLKDRNDHLWLSNINVDIEEILTKSNKMLVMEMLNKKFKNKKNNN